MLQMTVRGAPYERGRQIGEAFRDRLRGEIDEQRERALRGWTLDAAEAAMGNMLFAMLRYAPRYVDEIRGVADGAGISVRDAFVLNVAPAFAPMRAAFAPGDGAYGDSSKDEAGCSNIAVPHTTNGPVLVKTVDGSRESSREEIDDMYVLIRFQPTAGEDWLPYASVHMPGRLWPELGMNAAGLGAGQSSVPAVPGQRGHGIPVQWIIRPALEYSRTVKHAVGLLASLPMCGKGMNIGLIDAEGGAAGVEKSGAQQVVFWPEGGYAAVTNAYRSPVMANAFPAAHQENSEGRLRALESLFGGPLRDPAARDENAIVGLLRYHAQRPDHESICQHGTELYTHHGFLLWAQQREIWGTNGNPCRAPFMRIPVEADAPTGQVTVVPTARTAEAPVLA